MITVERFLHSLHYKTDRTHAGAPYTLDGMHYMNHGQLCEVMAKAAHGLDVTVDANTPFDRGSDIPQFSASVKSSRATLCTEKLDASYDGFIAKFFQRTASTSFWYVEDAGELVTIYKMDAETFEKFLRRFAKLNDRGVVRIAKTSKTMLYWLEHEA